MTCAKKTKKNPADYRPDICHQELLALMDSPLNKAGRLKVYIRTENNVLIEFNPAIRVPRTFKRFSGLMVQLLHKMKIKASTGDVLLKVVKNPFSQYLPAGVRGYGLSVGGTLYSPAAVARTLVPDVSSNGSSIPSDVCFVIGAMASGSISRGDHEFIEKMIGISEYPLSGAAAINRLLGSIETQWDIV
uniref:Ribosomal RNA small subunit methyltransferase NEP1 n=1 Tax=Corethron hystrix TaxID=216773 RepID=A0A7S1G1N4_9STRA|mmetsp:Transcript_6540/g.14134  ORF Transcript_6540/g.14134 Transcript_6540/m.14134 type:complete len:189 (+) Transcript_6540:334-900(+)